MMHAAFAQNPTDLTVADTLSALVESQPEQRWAILIDTAFDHPDPLFYQRDLHHNCYAFPELVALQPAAPCLIPLANDKTSLAFLRYLLVHCSGRPMLSLLALTVEPEVLVAQWRPLHWIHDPDGQKLLLRVADTRTVACMPAVLTPAQQAAWLHGIQTWYYIDRQGLLASWQLPDTATAPASQMTLDDSQFSALMAHTEADQALTTLRASIPDDYSGADYFRDASHALQLADQHGITSWSDRLVLIGVTCSPHGPWLVQGDLSRLLATHEGPPGTLGAWLAAQAEYRQAIAKSAQADNA